jgi:hypothetical protein
MKKLLPLSLLLATGCYMHSLETRPWRPTDVYSTDTRVSFLWGITGATGAATGCDYGIAREATYMPWWSAIVSLITVGIVVPTSTDYVCAEYRPPPAVQVVPAPPQQQPPGTPPPGPPPY